MFPFPIGFTIHSNAVHPTPVYLIARPVHLCHPKPQQCAFSLASIKLTHDACWPLVQHAHLLILLTHTHAFQWFGAVFRGFEFKFARARSRQSHRHHKHSGHVCVCANPCWPAILVGHARAKTHTHSLSNWFKWCACGSLVSRKVCVCVCALLRPVRGANTKNIRAHTTTKRASLSSRQSSAVIQLRAVLCALCGETRYQWPPSSHLRLAHHASPCDRAVVVLACTCMCVNT